MTTPDSSLTTALVGLLGAAVGGFLTIAKDVLLQKRSEKKDAHYLCIQVVSLLEQFALSCHAVAYDDGEPDEEGYTVVGVKSPEFDPQSLDVVWKTLPTQLLYRVLDLPNLQRSAREDIDVVASVAGWGPDSDEFFEERQLQYAQLGQEAFDLASALRYHAGLPRPTYADWDPIRRLRDKERDILAERAQRRRRSAADMPDLADLLPAATVTKAS